MSLKINIKMLAGCEDLVPQRQHISDSGFDLKSREELLLRAGEIALVPTGLFLELPLYYEAQVRPRSGLAARSGITVLNSPGTVDAGYRGEVQAILINHSKEDFKINRGDRIAQMVIQKIPEVELVVIEDLSESDRGEGGFGSTGLE
jgi:dUTP pyrophosphatase